MGRIGLIIAGLMVAFAVIAPMQVSGHAEYDHSTPGDGEVVAAAPAVVHVYFTEDVAATSSSFLNVVNSSNADVDLNNSMVDGGDHTHMTIGLQGALPDGVYTVQWQTQAEEDGDVEEGEFSFTVGIASVGGIGGDTGGGSGGLSSATAVSAISILLIAVLTIGGGAWFVRRHSETGSGL